MIHATLMDCRSSLAVTRRYLPLREAREFLHHAFVDLALERHHQVGEVLHRLPAPFDEFRLVGAAGRMLHVDFTRVSLTEKTRADVPLHFVKESPAVRTLGAVLLHALSEVTVEAFPQDIPRAIEVDLSGLQEIDDAIFVRDLVVDATTVRITNDPDELVVKAMPVKIEEEAKPAEAAVPAEGEVAAEGEAAEGATPPTTGAEAAKAPAAEGAKASAAAKPATGAPPKPATGAPKKA